MLKRYPLFVLLFFYLNIACAQTSINYLQYAIGGGASYIRGYTNLNIQDNHFAENINFTYYLTGYMPLTAEFQVGTLSGGSVVLDPSNRFYINHYYALVAHLDYQLGQFTDQDNFFSNFFFGSGAGLIYDNNKVQRYSLVVASYRFPGVDQSLNPMVPFRVGYEIKVLNHYDEPSIRIELSYTHTFVFGEGLDGYSDPPSHFKDNNIDQYRQISIGIKYGFGQHK